MSSVTMNPEANHPTRTIIAIVLLLALIGILLLIMSRARDQISSQAEIRQHITNYLVQRNEALQVDENEQVMIRASLNQYFENQEVGEEVAAEDRTTISDYLSSR